MKEIKITVLDKETTNPQDNGDSNLVLIIGAAGAGLVLLFIVIGLAIVLITRRQTFEVRDPEPVALPAPVQAIPQNLAGATAHVLPPPPVPPASEE